MSYADYMIDPETGEDIVPDIDNNDDILLWPDGCWCWYSDYSRYTSDCPKSDDFERIRYGTDKWFDIRNCR